MFKTDNWQILFSHHGLNPGDVIVAEGRRMEHTIEDTDLYEEMERRWDKRYREAVQKGKNLGAGPQYRLSHYTSFRQNQEIKLVLYVAQTDYREFVGTNVEAGTDPEYMARLVARGRERFGDEDAFFSQTLAICSSVTTGDGKVVIGLRGDSNKVAEYARCWHTIGGHPRASDYQGRMPDFFHAMAGQLTRELGLKEGEISNLKLTGLVRNQRTRKPELIFDASISPDFDDVRQRRGPERDEHLKFFGAPWQELPAFLNANQTRFAFPSYPHLDSQKEADRLTPEGIPEDSTNYFVPSGEAAWVLHLAGKGVNIARELPYIQTA